MFNDHVYKNQCIADWKAKFLKKNSFADQFGLSFQCCLHYLFQAKNFWIGFSTYPTKSEWPSIRVTLPNMQDVDRCWHGTSIQLFHLYWASRSWKRKLDNQTYASHTSNSDATNNLAHGDCVPPVQCKYACWEQQDAVRRYAQAFLDRPITSHHVFVDWHPAPVKVSS